jgi:hypothetical protein
MSTRLPAISRPTKRRPEKQAVEAHAVAAVESEPEFEQLSVPPTRMAAPTPISCLTHAFDVYELFGDGIQTFSSASVYEKKKSLRKLMNASGMGTVTKTDNLTKESVAVILGETERLVKHLWGGEEAFLTLFAKITGLRITSHLNTVFSLCHLLLLDRSVTAHIRLASLGMFDTGFLVENGQFLAKMVINADAMRRGVRKVGADDRYRRLLDTASVHIARQALTTELLRAAIPAGWRLHADTNTPLTDREVEEQNSRIAGEFLFLAVGLLQALSLEQQAILTINKVLLENGL